MRSSIATTLLRLGPIVLTVACATPASRVDDASPAVRDRAAERGMIWIAGYLADEENAEAVGWDAVQIFLEPAVTSADPGLRRLGRERARVHGHRLAKRLLAARLPLENDEILDLLALIVEAKELGLDPAPLRAKARAVFGALEDPDDVYGFEPLVPEEIERASDQDVFDLLLTAYGLESARLHGVWPGGTFRLADLLAVLETRRLRALGEDPSPDKRGFRDDVYLATHIAYVLSDYGRSRLRREDAPWVYAYLDRVFPEVLASRDVELVAEIVDVWRTLGADETTHPLVRAGTRLLLETQNPDGSWDAWEEHPGPYHVVHPTWCATAALRERRLFADTPWERHVRAVLRRASR